MFGVRSRLGVAALVCGLLVEAVLVSAPVGVMGADAGVAPGTPMQREVVGGRGLRLPVRTPEPLPLSTVPNFVPPVMGSVGPSGGTPVEIDLESGAWVDVPGSSIRLQVGDGSLMGSRGVPRRSQVQARRHARVRVRVLGAAEARSVGLDGVAVEVLDVTAGPAQPLLVRGEIDYSALRGAHSADWPFRVQVAPGCAQIPCAASLVASVNDPAAMTITYEIEVSDGSLVADQPVLAAAVMRDGRSGLGTVARRRALGLPSVVGSSTASAVRSSSKPAVGGGSGGSLYGLTAGFASQFGSYQATPLLASSGWSAGSQAGSFDWSYPLPSVPTGWGAAPSFQLSYSSQQLDGLAPDQNGQQGSFGYGWNLNVGGYIERTYRTCSIEGLVGAEDLCWLSDSTAGVSEVLTLVMGGHASPLYQVNPNEWRLQGDPLVRVIRATGAPGSPDDNGEWFEATMSDGTRVLFGSAPDRLASTWAVQVIGNDAGEPCFGVVGGCPQGWRFNLDQSIDTNGNTVEFHYSAESNMYLPNGSSSLISYTRGGLVDEVRYGLNPAAGVTVPHARIRFVAKDRCDATPQGVCAWSSPGSSSTPYYPDTPTDLTCNTVVQQTCQAPAFYSMKIITAVETAWSVDGTTWNPVDAVQFVSGWVTPVTNNPPQLWLEQINRTGFSGTGGSITLPSVVIGMNAAQPLANRHDAVVVKYWRVDSITDELGLRVHPTYGQPDGCAGMPALGWDDNKQNCFPRWVVRAPGDEGFGEFNQYVVTSVEAQDTTGLSPTVLSQYQYLDKPAWHYDDSANLHATWSDYRGYGRVRITQGASGQTQTSDEFLYFRGMDGDHLAGGGSRPVTFTDHKGTLLTDQPYLRGLVYESRALLDTGGTQVSEYSYTEYSAVANSANLASVRVRVVGTIRDVLVPSSSTWLRTQDSIGYDSIGRVTSQFKFADTSTAIDDSCTVTTYAPANETAWILDRPATVNVRASTCTGALLRSSEYAYDGGVVGGSPTKGNVTMTRAFDGSSWAAVTFQIDTAGHVTSTNGPLTGTPDDVTTASYHPTFGFPTSTTDALGHVTSLVTDPARGVVSSAIDANGKATTLSYDAVGRLRKVWKPNNPTSGTPSIEYLYSVTGTTPAKVTTRVRQSATAVLESFAFADGFGRTVQTQRRRSWGPVGVVLDDSRYDSRGLQTTNTPQFVDLNATAGTYLVVPANAANQTRSTFDTRGRLITSAHYGNGTFQFQSTLAYDGRTITTLRPSGSTSGSPAKTIETYGGLGELKETRSATSATTWATTTYTYDALGQQRTVNDPIGALTTSNYDLVGRVTSKIDADRGTTTFTYDAAGNVATTITSNGTLWYKNDSLGRPIERRNASSNGPLVATWAYDKPGELGLLDYTVTYNGAVQYKQDVVGYDQRGRPTGTTDIVPVDPAYPNSPTGSYTTGFSYDDADHQTSITYPAYGGQAAETVTTSYDDAGFASTMTGDSPYVTQTAYKAEGWLDFIVRGSSTGGYSSTQSWGYDHTTGRVTSINANKTTNATTTSVFANSYTYDNAGNVTAVGESAPADRRQCFSYDDLQRLTRAYTVKFTRACSTSYSSQATAPYNQAFTYDAGSRITSFGTSNSGGTAGTSTYTYGTSGHPHAVSTVSTATGANTYAYNAAGQRTVWTKPGTAGSDAYSWNSEGRLADVVSGGAPTHLRTVTTTAANTSDTRSLTVPQSTTGSNTYLTTIAAPAPATPVERYEAESATLNGGPSISTCATCSGGKAVGGFSSADPNQYIEFQVTAATAGTYTLYSVAQSSRVVGNLGMGVGTTRRLFVNGATVDNAYHLGLSSAFNSVAVTLNQGTNTIRIQSPLSSPASTTVLDYIAIAPHNDPWSSIEAETSTISGNSQSSCTCSGVSGVLSDSAAGDNWIDFNLNAPAAGTYQVDLVYIATTNPRRKISLNGQVLSANLTFGASPQSDSDNRKSWFLTLNAGSNTLRIESSAAALNQGLVIYDRVRVAATNGAADLVAGSNQVVATTSNSPTQILLTTGPSSTGAVTATASFSAPTQSVITVSEFSGVSLVDTTASATATTTTTHPVARPTIVGERRLLFNATGLGMLATTTATGGATKVGTAAGQTGVPTVQLTLSTAPMPGGTPPTGAGITSTLTTASSTLAVVLHPAATSMLYDANGSRLLQRTPNGSVTLYLSNLTQIGNGTLTRNYFHLGHYIASRTGGQLAYTVTNIQDSVTATINATTGTVSYNYFTPYGQQLQTGTTTPRTFLGEIYDTTIGLNYLNNRYHDPATGVFLSVDPLVAKTGEPYLYAGGNPTTLSDPSGLSYGCGANGCIDDKTTVKEQQWVMYQNTGPDLESTISQLKNEGAAQSTIDSVKEGQRLSFDLHYDDLMRIREIQMTHYGKSALGWTITICFGVCFQTGVYIDADGFHWVKELGGVGYGASTEGHVVADGGACGQRGWGIGFSGGEVVVAGVSASSTPIGPNGEVWQTDGSTTNVSVGVGGGAPISGGPTYTWVTGC